MFEKKPIKKTGKSRSRFKESVKKTKKNPAGGSGFFFWIMIKRKKKGNYREICCLISLSVYYQQIRLPSVKRSNFLICSLQVFWPVLSIHTGPRTGNPGGIGPSYQADKWKIRLAGPDFSFIMSFEKSRKEIFGNLLLDFLACILPVLLPMPKETPKFLYSIFNIRLIFLIRIKTAVLCGSIIKEGAVSDSVDKRKTRWARPGFLLWLSEKKERKFGNLLLDFLSVSYHRFPALETNWLIFFSFS